MSFPRREPADSAFRRRRRWPSACSISKRTKIVWQLAGWWERPGARAWLQIASLRCARGGIGVFWRSKLPGPLLLLQLTGCSKDSSPVPAGLVKRISLGGMPRRLAFDVSGTTAVVADEAGSIRFLR